MTARKVHTPVARHFVRSVSFLLRPTHLNAYTSVYVHEHVSPRSSGVCGMRLVDRLFHRRDILYRVAQKRWKSVAGTYSLTNAAPCRLSLGENFCLNPDYDRANSISSAGNVLLLSLFLFLFLSTFLSFLPLYVFISSLFI